MSKAFYQKIHSRFPECTLQVEDLETYVREWEKTVQRGADQATWFEEYVSGTSGPFARTITLEWGTYSTIHYSQDMHCIRIFMLLYICVSSRSSNPIVCSCILVTREENIHCHMMLWYKLIHNNFAHDPSKFRHWHDNASSISLVLILKHEYPDIVNWYEELSKKFPEIVKFVPSIGKSVEGRDMSAVHITASSTDALKIYFQCQIHASKSPCYVYSLLFVLDCLATVLVFLQESGYLGPLAITLLAF